MVISQIDLQWQIGLGCSENTSSTQGESEGSLSTVRTLRTVDRVRVAVQRGQPGRISCHSNVTIRVYNVKTTQLLL